MGEKTNKPLEISKIELANTNIIEASAGTGKTFSLALLFLKTLLEKSFPLESILVVTFTNAATEELRDRIGKFIDIALKIIDGKEEKESSEAQRLKELIDKAVEKNISKTILKFKLLDAYYKLDQASIFTIHSFCRRILEKHPFQSGSYFENELIKDESLYRKRAVELFYKEEIDTLSASLLLCLKKKLTLENMLKFYQNYENKGNLEIKALDVSNEELIDFEKSWEDLKKFWEQEKDELENYLRKSKNFKRNKDNFKLENLEKLLAELKKFIETDSIDIDILKKFTKENIEEQTSSKPKEAIEDYQFFSCCSKVVNLILKFISYFKKESFNFIKKYLEQEKKIHSLRSFNDLLTDTHQAIENSNFLKAVRANYNIAFIDEFQDTDAIQWEIFEKIFEDKPLFLIGDPKQAIYSFRGADIYTYFKARELANNIFNLDTNYRSSRNLLGAINEIFSKKDAFQGEDRVEKDESAKGKNKISYQEIIAGKAENEKILKNGKGQILTPFVIWNDENLGKKINSKTALNDAKIIEKAVVTEIKSLLTEDYLIQEDQEERKVRLSDLAILVASHKEARSIQKMLSKAGINAVIPKSGSVFESKEAKNLFNIINAFENPSNSKLLRTVLLSEFYNCSKSKDLEDNEEILTAFKEYQRLFENYGFFTAINRFFKDNGARFFSFNDRKLTNYRHLVELIHGAQKENNYAIRELISWYSEKLALLEENEEYEMRLESDQEAVQILTVHKSKGLEYNIVFCPFFHTSPTEPKEEVLYHNEENKLILKLNSATKKDKDKAFQEAFEEKLRLFYVAVTRASVRCYTFLPLNFKENKMVKNPDKTPSFSYLERFSGEAGDKNDYIEVRNIPVKDSPENSGEEKFENKSEEVVKVAKEFTGKIEAGDFVFSYSAITKHGETKKEITEEVLKEAEEQQTSASEIPYENSIISFVRGANAGNALHEIMEKVLERNNFEIDQIVETTLSSYNILDPENKWKESVAKVVAAILESKLEAEKEVFKLKDVKNLVPEMEFYLSSSKINENRIKEIIADEDILIKEGDFRGWLHGFIDLFFEYNGKYYILDWKSNYLGKKREDYQIENVLNSMNENNYHLQYYIYTIAVNNYLKQNLENYSYSQNFGGVFYIYFRGFDEAVENKQFGVYFKRPQEEVIKKLTELFVN